MQSEHTYSVLKENENPSQSIIRKSNVNVDFTLDELAANEKSYRKLLNECASQKNLADAKMKNIEDNHPFVMDLTEEQAFTVHMYQEARAMSRVCGNKIPELQKEIEYIESEKKEIEKQIGIAIPKSALESKPEDKITPDVQS